MSALNGESPGEEVRLEEVSDVVGCEVSCLILKLVLWDIDLNLLLLLNTLHDLLIDCLQYIIV